MLMKSDMQLFSLLYIGCQTRDGNLDEFFQQENQSCPRSLSSMGNLFLIRHRALVKRLLSQGYKVNRLSNTFKKFYGRHTDLVGQYKKNVCQMFADSIS